METHAIFVSLLPTLESVLYGANISDILTRFTHPSLNIIGWLPYGVGHFTIPFVVVAAFLWLSRTKQALLFWARAFGYMNMVGVIIQTSSHAPHHGTSSSTVSHQQTTP